MLQDSSIPWIFLLILLLLRLVFVEGGGGGRLLAPQGRGSVWEQEVGSLPDFENESNCGGVLRQWGTWGGMCGVCGDEWGIPPPRPHELGGRWGSGGVVQTYLPGQTIDVEIEISQSLGGSFQLQLCPDPEEESEECFSKHPVSLATTSNTTYHPLVGNSLVKLAYQLPVNMTCSHCVLRWRYTTNHTVTLDHQDNFYQNELRVCADIAIQGGNSEVQAIEVNTIQATGAEVSLLEVKKVVTENYIMGVDILDESESKTVSEFTTLSAPVTSRTDVTTIASIDDVIENSTESVETPLTTTMDNNVEIDLDEDNVKLIDHEETMDRNVIKDEQVVDKTDNSEEITVKPGVMEIKIIGGESVEEEVPVYTVSPQHMPVEYNLIRIRNNTLGDETHQEDEKPDYEITRTKPTAKSDSQISSSPANVTSAIPLSASIPTLQTTDRISEAATVTPTGVSVAASTTTQTTTTVSTTETIMKSSAVILPLFISTETQETTTVQYLSTQSSSTTTKLNPTTATTLSTTTTVPTSPRSTTTQTTTTTTKTLPMVTLIITNPATKSATNTTPTTTQPPTNTAHITTTTTPPPTQSTHITTTTTLLPKNVPKQAKDSKIVPNSPNSISVETLKKVPSPEPTIGVQRNHTVIYQVFSRGPSLGYGLFLSVPAAIIFFVGVFLIYIKKSSEVPSPKKPQSNNQSGSTMYHSVPKDEKEVEEGDITHLTNMTSSTTLITNEYIPMSPEYAIIPDVVPSSVRNSQRHRLDDSVDDGHCCPGNSMPNLPQVTNTPPQAANHHTENAAVQYSSLNELNSPGNSPKPGGKEISHKRWQSDDLDAEKKAQDAPVDGWTPHQRWKSEDWEKDQSFIALLARRLEHVDSRAEVTEL